jgi:hypothetical protein
MKAKTIISAILLAFIAGSLAYLIFDEVRRDRTDMNSTAKAGSERSPAGGSGADEPPGAPQPTDRVVAYYFHGTKRCHTCTTIEAYTKEALKLNFPDRLGNGTLEWRVINVEDPEHDHFVQDFELTIRSVVLVDETDEERHRWKNLNRVWELVSNEEAFASYITDETRSFFGEDNG